MNDELYLLKNNRYHYHKNKSLYRRNIARDILRNDNGKFRGITEHKFNLIINRILELKVAQLYNKGYVHLGHGLGNIVITMFEKNSTDIRHYAVDWDKTLKLWVANNKAKEAKKLVRVIDYNKCVKFVWRGRCKKPNMGYYKFVPLRSLRKQLYFDVINNKNIMFYE